MLYIYMTSNVTFDDYIVKCEKNKTGFNVHWLHDNMVFYSHVLMHCDIKKEKKQVSCQIAQCYYPCMIK